MEEQNEIDMLDRQVDQEYDSLTDMIRDNSFLISSQGEDARVSKEDPIAPIEVLHNNGEWLLVGFCCHILQFLFSLDPLSTV